MPLLNASGTVFDCKIWSNMAVISTTSTLPECFKCSADRPNASAAFLLFSELMASCTSFVEIGSGWFKFSLDICLMIL